MDDRERCPKNPSMLKAYCSHCQGTERGTTDNHRYSLKEGNFEGYPVVEVLKNGCAIHMRDEHFRFGQRKAEILVACVSLIRNFGWSTDSERFTFTPKLVENRKRGLRVQISVEMYPEFEHSSGSIIERPWLRLQALPPDYGHIGLGMLKCRAVAAVEDALRSWLRKVGVPD
jgi:hypothetical protein